jgi:WS/DGAT/MGAT family acyltransferase
MHVGWLATLLLTEGSEPLDAALVRRRIAARLGLAPRFRQRVAWAPVGEPSWVDDPGFDLANHLRVHEGDAPSRAELDEVAGEFLSRQLDRSRPLWEILLVPKLADEARGALIGKVHHAMVDGIAAVELGTLLFDLAPDAALPEGRDWQPERAPGPLQLAAHSVVDGAVEQFRTVRQVAALGLAPRRSLRVAETMRRAALQVAEDLIRPAPPSFLNPQIGPRRALFTVRLPIERLVRIKDQRDVKLNDIVLAAAAGALRRFAASRGEEPVPLRTMVPVSVRRGGESGGNRITFAFLDLPLDEPRPLRRLSILHGRTQELKRSGRVAGSEAILRGVGQLPGFLKERAARMAASPRMYNLTVSNVPGPRVGLYVAGAEVEAIYPVIPIAAGHALAIGVLTYRDAVHVACYVDPDALPGAAELPSLFETAVAELESASRRKTRRRRDEHSRRADQVAVKTRP